MFNVLNLVVLILFAHCFHGSFLNPFIIQTMIMILDFPGTRYHHYCSLASYVPGTGEWKAPEAGKLTITFGNLNAYWYSKVVDYRVEVMQVCTESVDLCVQLYGV